MEYVHEELIRELEIEKNTLPKAIKDKIKSFNVKRTLAKNPAIINTFGGLSELIADDITAWHYANNQDEDEKKEEVIPVVPVETVKPVEEVVVVPVVVTVQNNNQQEPTVNPEIENNGWGLKSSW